MVGMDMDINTEEGENDVTKCEPDCKEIRKCRCSELEEGNRKAAEKIMELELEIGKMKTVYEELEAKLKDLVAEKTAIEGELKVLRVKNNAVQERSGCMGDERKANCRVVQEVERVVDLTEEEDEFQLIMIENKTLECEKKRAESEAEMWKKKFKELKLQVSKLEASDLVDADAVANPGTPYIHTPGKQEPPLILKKRGIDLESEVECGRQIRKYLSFKEERSPGKTMAPSTPGVAKTSCHNVIDIRDSDDEGEVTGTPRHIPNDHLIRNVRVSMEYSLGRIQDRDNISSVATPKRKRAANVIASDTESDEDDNVPLSELKRMHLQESNFNRSSSGMKSCSANSAPCVSDDVKGVMTRSKRRLRTLRQREGKVDVEGRSSSKATETKYQRGIPTTGDIDDSESEEVESESEGESLGGFIVESSDVSDSNAPKHSEEQLYDDVSDASDSNAPNQSEEESDDNVNFDGIISQIRRRKDHSLKWEFEADMLAAFGKDHELCMKAVCALYRQQTSEEQTGKETFVDNHRGFSKFDARRGSKLAEFLTEGDPFGDVKKSVQELQEYDSQAVNLCHKLAAHYSKQLFEIYKNKEDPLFLPH